MSDIICSKCHYSSFTRSISHDLIVCDNCDRVFKLEEIFKSIPIRKFQQLSYEEVDILLTKVNTGMIIRDAEGCHIASRLQKELKEELEIRG